jgi:trehalose-6-phosphatase
VLLPGFIGLFPVYLGEDIADENAFLLLPGHGMTIKVGRPGTEIAASHYEAVRHFLSLLAAPLEDS